MLVPGFGVTGMTPPNPTSATGISIATCYVRVAFCSPGLSSDSYLRSMFNWLFYLCPSCYVLSGSEFVKTSFEEVLALFGVTLKVRLMRKEAESFFFTAFCLCLHANASGLQIHPSLLPQSSFLLSKP